MMTWCSRAVRYAIHRVWWVPGITPAPWRQDPSRPCLEKPHHPTDQSPAVGVWPCSVATFGWSFWVGCYHCNCAFREVMTHWGILPRLSKDCTQDNASTEGRFHSCPIARPIVRHLIPAHQSRRPEAPHGCPILSFFLEQCGGIQFRSCVMLTNRDR